MIDEQTRWIIPGYAADEMIGFGASGEVWRGKALDTGEAVALKRLRSGTAEQARQRLAREAALLARIDHPHLLRVRELVSTSEETVLVLDYASGGSLADLLRRRHRLRAGEVVTILAPVAAALAYAHDEGLVHGDVSPANVLFGQDGRPVLADLGVARVLGERDDPLCTPEYMDPAVAAGGTPGTASDVFMVAAVALHALTGVPPWRADSPQQAVALAATGRVPQLDTDVTQVPEELMRSIRRALAADPAVRGTAAELALDMRHACRPEPVQVVGPASSGQRDDGADVDPSAAVTHAVRGHRTASTQQTDVPAGSRSARHRRDDRRRGAAGSQRQRGRGVRRVRSIRRRLGVLVALLVAALVGMAWGVGGVPGRTADRASRLSLPLPSASPPAQGPPPSRVAPTEVERGRTKAAARHWLGVLDDLDGLRALAYSRGDARLLEQVYVAGRHLRIDSARLRALTSRGDTARGVSHSWGRLDILSSSTRRVRLRVVQWLPPCQRLHGGTVVATIPGTPPTAVIVDLVPTRAGWRLA